MKKIIKISEKWDALKFSHYEKAGMEFWSIDGNPICAHSELNEVCLIYISIKMAPPITASGPFKEPNCEIFSLLIRGGVGGCATNTGWRVHLAFIQLGASKSCTSGLEEDTHRLFQTFIIVLDVTMLKLDCNTESFEAKQIIRQRGNERVICISM